MTEKIILLSGPTATGKSSLALKIAETIDAELINADSIQLYHDLSVLTARPNTEKEKIKHHFYGFLNGDISWSVGKWINEVSDLKQKTKNNTTYKLILITQFNYYLFQFLSIIKMNY